MNARKRTIAVRLTQKEWNALVRTATGELESLTTADWKAGLGKDLDSALWALYEGQDKTRERAKKARAKAREVAKK